MCKEFPLTLSMHVQDYDHFNLEVGYEDGRDRVLLWLPTICKHVITDESPLASWLKPSGIMADADATIVIVVSALSCNTPCRPCSLTASACLSPVQQCALGNPRRPHLARAWGHVLWHHRIIVQPLPRVCDWATLRTGSCTQYRT